MKIDFLGEEEEKQLSVNQYVNQYFNQALIMESFKYLIRH